MHSLARLARLVLPLAAAVALSLLGCEQHYSADPPPAVPERSSSAPSSGGLAAVLALGTADAGARVDSFHAMTVTSCTVSPQSCTAPEADASPSGMYRIVFGSGRGAIRSHTQATADLYEELRNRTILGEWVDAQLRTPGGALAPVAFDGRPAAVASRGSSDAIAQCAVRLLDFIDGVGAMTLDGVHGVGSANCMVSVGASAVDGGAAAQCLVQAPEHVTRPRIGGLTW